MTPDQYCQEKTARSGSSFYYSFLFLPEPERVAITALYAFCREVDDIVDECTDPQIARLKLQWWRDSLHLAFAGEAQHPVLQALLNPIQRYRLELTGFLAIIDGMEMDLTQNRYTDFNELRLYCHRVAGVVGLLAARIFGYQDCAVKDYAENLGIAFQLTNIIRDIREDARRGRIYLPLEDLRHFEVTEQDIFNSTALNPLPDKTVKPIPDQTQNQTRSPERKPAMSPKLRQLLQFQVERAEGFYTKAFAALPEPERYNQRCGLIMASLYHEVLRTIATDVNRVLLHRVSLSPGRKLWLAWRSARAEKKRRRKQHQLCN